MMKASDVFSTLQERWWVDPLIHNYFPYTVKMATPPQYKLYPEVTIRIPTEQTTRFGTPKPQRRRFDAVAIVKPHYRAWGDDLLTVGFEIKVSKSDLLNDNKLLEYLGHTDFMFLVVPSDLVSIAVSRVDTLFAHGPNWIGVLDAQTATIVKFGCRQFTKAEAQAELYRELTFRSLAPTV